LLTGEVISKDLQQYAVDLVSNLDKVKRVHNELTINSLANFSERSGDTWLTSKVKGKMLSSKELDASRVKVVSESDTVYLMGLVTPDEGQIAARIASETEGVQKVITLFEYIDPAQVEDDAKIQTPKMQKL
jgi:osmotically-inducible protein OsmY